MLTYYNTFVNMVQRYFLREIDKQYLPGCAQTFVIQHQTIFE